MEVIRLDQVSLWRRTQEEFSYDLKKTVLGFLEGKYRNPAKKLILDRIDLVAETGEKVGIIGANGAGKSTLLKVISGILEPSSGSVRVRGNIAPLIELGAGLDLDISVSKNIILYGVMLGFSKAEMRRRSQSILEFAELEDYARVPVKALSSGMMARLGFAIATDVQPDILILDEVLSVGDESFRRKCRQRMERFWKTDTTTLVVSHDLAFVRKFCERCIWLERGRVKFAGDTEETIQLYLDTVALESEEVVARSETVTLIVEEAVTEPNPIITEAEEAVSESETETLEVEKAVIEFETKTLAIEEEVFEQNLGIDEDISQALPALNPIPRVLNALPCSQLDWLMYLVSHVTGQSALEHNLLQPSELISVMDSQASEHLICEHFDYDRHGTILTPARYSELRMVLLYRNPLDFLVSNFHARAYLGSLPDNELSAMENLKLFLRGYWIEQPIADSIRSSRLFSMSLREYFRRCVVEWYQSGYCLPIRYEDLVGDTEQQLRQILDYLDVPHYPEFLTEALERHNFPILGGGYSPQALGQSSYYWLNIPGEWSKFLNREDIDIVYNQIGDYIELLGYPLD